MNDQTPAPDYAAASNYAARVLAHPGKHDTEAVAAARVLQHLLPAPTLAEMTITERADTPGMWATIDPGDGSDTWRGIIVRSNRHAPLVCNPTDMRGGMGPTAAPASTITPDPSVPRAWNADGTPARPEPAPDSTLAPGSMWGEGHGLGNALDQSPYTRAVVIDRDGDLTAWVDGYWQGAGFHPDSDRGEGPWKIAWVGTE